MRRVVLVVPSFPVLSENFVLKKYLRLLERGWDVHVVCGKSKEREWERFRVDLHADGHRDRVHVRWPRRPHAIVPLLLPLLLVKTFLQNPQATLRYIRRGWRRFGLAILRQFYLDAQLVELNPDIIHFEFGSSARGYMHLGALLGARTVVSFRGHDLSFVGLDEPGFYKQVWDQADTIHCLGEDLWQRAQRRGCPSNKRRVLIGTALEPEQYRADEPRYDEDVGTAERPLRLLSVGRMNWTKGHEYALQAVQILQDQGVHVDYRIIGDGEFRPAVAFARHQLALNDCVTLLGEQSPEAVRHQLSRADIFLHLAVSEGFCNAVMEAQAAGRPVVCSDAGGLPENVVNGVSGIVVRRRDPAAAAEQLYRLACDSELRARMGRAGENRVRERFDLDAQTDAFEKMYFDLLNQR